MAVTRKEFLIQLAVGGAAVGALAAIASFLESCTAPTEPQGTSLPTVNGTLSGNKITVDISSGSPLTQNSFAIVQYSGGSLLVAHTSDGTYHAMTAICTHQGCTINQYSSSSNEFVCQCHGSRFNATGGVTNGPASSPLKQYTATVSGTQLIITVA